MDRIVTNNLKDNYNDIYENIRNRENKIVIESNDSLTKIIKIDDSLDFIHRCYTHMIYNQFNKYNDFVSLGLDLKRIESFIKDENNILDIKQYEDFNFMRSSIINGNINTDEIIFYCSFNKDVFNFSYKLEIQLNTCAIHIVLKNRVMLKNFNWNREMKTYIYNDNKLFIFKPKSNDELIEFLKKYINDKNPKLEIFINKYIVEHFRDLNEFVEKDLFNNFWLELKSNIKMENKKKSLGIGLKKMDIIKNGIEKYFLPIIINDDAETYVKNFDANVFDEKCIFIKMKSNNINEKEIDVLIQESIAKINFINGKSVIDIYTGELISDLYEIAYNDSISIILKTNSNSFYKHKMFFSKTKNNIWVESNEIEKKEIYDRFEIINSIQ